LFVAGGNRYWIALPPAVKHDFCKRLHNCPLERLIFMQCGKIDHPPFDSLTAKVCDFGKKCKNWQTAAKDIS
jgi:hypothetical protein